MRLSSLCRMAAVCAAIAWVGTGSVAMAQAPMPLYPAPPAMVVPAAPASPEAADIAACMCLQQAVASLGAQMAGGRQSYDQTLSELARLDAQLERERGTMDVNSPTSVARFRQLLQERDALYRRSSGPVMTDLSAVVARYNARVNEYNARCADRPRNPAIVASVQATLSCPSP
jgi:hypothetical protein